MKIAIDARMINKSGIGIYIKHIMENINYDIVLDNSNFPCKNYSIKEQLFFPYKKLRREKVDVLHVPHLNIPIFYKGKLIVTIHDLTHLKYPQFLPSKFHYLYFRFMLGMAVKKASKIIAVSHNTKKDIIDFFNISPDKIKVVHHGIGNEFVIKQKSEVFYLYKKYNISPEKRIILYVGNLLPHKNLNGLLKAVPLIKKDHTLILVGKRFKERSIRVEMANYPSLLCVDEISRNELVDLYNIADLFVLPSLYEGFGFPVLESLACGTPVACSNTSSLPEVGGSFAFYFDPCDEANIADVINKALESKSDPVALREHALKFSWEKTAGETLDEINSLADEASYQHFASGSGGLEISGL